MKIFQYLSIVLITGMISCMILITSCDDLNQDDEVTSPAVSETVNLDKWNNNDLKNLPARRLSKSIVPQLEQRNTVTLKYFTDRTMLTNRIGTKPIRPVFYEDFENSNVPSNWVGFCDGPINSQTDNDCYSKGEIVDYLSLDAVGLNGTMAVLTEGYAWNSSTVVGPQWFVEDLEISFEGEQRVHAVGFDLLAPLHGPTNMTITIFGEGGALLGSTVVTTGTNVGAFWGVFSRHIISRILLEPIDDPTTAELVDNMVFR